MMIMIMIMIMMKMRMMIMPIMMMMIKTLPIFHPRISMINFYSFASLKHCARIRLTLIVSI